MREFLAVTKAMSDENRVRALMALSDGELCVCQIIELLGLAPSTVSKHMSILHQVGLVETRKDGRWTYFRLARGLRGTCPGKALAMMRSSLAEDSGIVRDGRRLAVIRNKKREKFCMHYRS